MNKSLHITIWGGCLLIFLVIAAWVYYQHSEQQDRLIRADQTIETGVALFKEKKYPEALDILEDIPPGVEREWYARYYQGSTHIMLKDYQAAIPYLEQALALNPTETQIMHALGVAYFKLGKLKLSRAYYASILEINPQDMEARGLLEAITNLDKQGVFEEEQAGNE